MRSFYDSCCDVKGAFSFSFVVFSLLLDLFSTAMLYGHPSSALAPAPAAPSHLTATAISSAHIDLTWTDNSNDEAGFKIEIKIGESGAFAQIATVGANVTSYSSTGLQTSTEHFYRVRAYNAGGNSAYSNEAGATTLPDIPAAPANLAATGASPTQINLTWTNNSNDETGFRIERKASSAATYIQVTTVGPNVTSFANTELNPNTAYFYRVSAFNTGGYSDYSNVAEAKTFPNLPLAPSNLSATAVSAKQIKLTWADNAGNELGFIIERKNGAAGTYMQIATVGINVKSYSNTGLSPNTNYFYRVQAYNAGGHSDYSDEASTKTLPLAPAAPGNLTAAAAGNDKIVLGWADNANNETGFKIERKTGAAAFAEIATVGANVKSFADEGLLAKTQYSYRLRAYNAGGHSGFSNEASATTWPNPPAPPSNLIATTVNANRIDLAWTDNAGNELGFRIERKNGAGGNYVQIATVGINVKSYSNTGLSPNTNYFYRVRAYNAGGHSDYSNETSAKTLPRPPKAPGDLTASTAGSSKLFLAWADSANNETGFKIERKTGATAYVEIATVGANVKNFTDINLLATTKYFYRVRAYNAGGFSAFTNEASATTLPNPPTAPNNLTAAVSPGKIQLSWTDNATDEKGFKVERKTGAAGTFAQIASIGVNKTSFVDSSPIGNTQYFYRVRAYNPGGHSGYSNEAEATTLPDPPAPPSNLTAIVVSDNRIDLAWTDNAGDEDGFTIERKTGAEGAYAEIATAGANVTGYSDTGLAENTQYFYRVRAYNIGGHSAYSNEAGAIPFNSVNLALNKPATASSTETGSSPNESVDGDLSTYWRSGFVNSAAPVAWLRVELSSSSPVPVGRAVVRWYQNYFAVEYELQVSNDGASWTTVYANDAGAAGAQDFSFAQTTAKFVRLYMKKHEKSNYRVVELEVYANPSAAKRLDSVAEAVIMPEAMALAQNYPNPFNPTTQIRYELPKGGQVSLIIYNSLGQEVRRLVDKQQAAGYHQVAWNGLDQNGKSVPSGIYHYRLQAADAAGASFVATKKMLMAK